MQKLSIMIKRTGLWIVLALISVFFNIHTVSAGMPGAFHLVFLDISHAPYQDGQALMIELRKLEGHNPGDDFQNIKPIDEDYQSGDCFSCRGGIDSYNSIGVIYLYTIPVGLTVEDARKAVAGDAEAKKVIQKILKEFHDHDNVGLDGMVLYEHVEGQVTLYAVTTEMDKPITSVSRPVKNYLRLNSLDQMMYQVTLNIPRYP